MEEPSYRLLAAHYEACLAEHGDSHKGVDWPSPDDAKRRYDVMLGVTSVTRQTPSTVLDIGCGAGHLLEYIQSGPWDHLDYRGLDISPQFINLCRSKFPLTAFDCVDLLSDPDFQASADFVIMNGVFTEKLTLSQEQMADFVQRLLVRAFSCTKIGLSFNVMSKLVDWERDDLFHWSFDEASAFISRHLSRHFVIRHDYRLYEYTFYVYR